MSYHVFFSLSEGLSKPIRVEKGWLQRIKDRVAVTENVLEIEREQYLNNPVRWKHTAYEGIEDKILCETAENHNHFVRTVYGMFQRCSENPPEKDYEEITPQQAQEFWPGLQFITVPPERWTGDYYTARMETLYEVMRGRPTDGITFGARKLTEKQAAQVIILFSEFLDHHDRRLEVPKGHDCLASSYDGCYEWCEQCGAITYEDSLQCSRKKCPLLKEYRENGEIE